MKTVFFIELEDFWINKIKFSIFNSNNSRVESSYIFSIIDLIFIKFTNQLGLFT